MRRQVEQPTHSTHFRAIYLRGTRCDRSGYCRLSRLLGERCIDQASPETSGNGWTGGGVGLLHLHARDPDHHTFETQSWMFDCSEKVREGRRGRNCNTDEARKQGAATERESVAEVVQAAREEVEEDKTPWFMFCGDLVEEIVRLTLDEFRGEQLDDLVGILGRVVGIPFKTHG